MPKLKDREPLRRYDFRVPEELLNDLTELYKLDKGKRTEAIHIAINNMIINGKTYSNAYQRCYVGEEKYTMHPYEKKYPRKNSKSKDDEASSSPSTA